MIVNCPVNFKDVTNAKQIFGPDVLSLKGKSVRRQPSAVIADYVEIPRAILDTLKFVDVSVDLMFVNQFMFFVSVSKRLKFTTIEYIPNHTKGSLITSIDKITRCYRTRDIVVCTLFADPEFAFLEERIKHTRVNTTAAREHVPEVERKICNIKNRMCAIHVALPFVRMPRHMTIELAKFVVLMLNAFPPSSGLSKTYSPRTIMTGKPLDYEKHCRLPFGAYAQTHEDRNITNNMITRTEGGICLGPTGNLEGSYSFLSLRTGRMVTRGHFYEVPTPGVVTRRVIAMAIAEGQHDGLIFEDQHGATLDKVLGNDDNGAIHDVADAAGVEVDVE